MCVTGESMARSCAEMWEERVSGDLLTKDDLHLHAYGHLNWAERSAANRIQRVQPCSRWAQSLSKGR